MQKRIHGNTSSIFILTTNLVQTRLAGVSYIWHIYQKISNLFFFTPKLIDCSGVKLPLHFTSSVHPSVRYICQLAERLSPLRSLVSLKLKSPKNLFYLTLYNRTGFVVNQYPSCWIVISQKPIICPPHNVVLYAVGVSITDPFPCISFQNYILTRHKSFYHFFPYTKKELIFATPIFRFAL